MYVDPPPSPSPIPSPHAHTHSLSLSLVRLFSTPPHPNSPILTVPLFYYPFSVPASGYLSGGGGSGNNSGYESGGNKRPSVTKRPSLPKDDSKYANFQGTVAGPPAKGGTGAGAGTGADKGDKGADSKSAEKPGIAESALARFRRQKEASKGAGAATGGDKKEDDGKKADTTRGASRAGRDDDDDEDEDDRPRRGADKKGVDKGGDKSGGGKGKHAAADDDEDAKHKRGLATLFGGARRTPEKEKDKGKEKEKEGDKVCSCVCVLASVCVCVGDSARGGCFCRLRLFTLRSPVPCVFGRRRTRRDSSGRRKGARAPPATQTQGKGARVCVTVCGVGPVRTPVDVCVFHALIVSCFFCFFASRRVKGGSSKGLTTTTCDRRPLSFTLYTQSFGPVL